MLELNDISVSIDEKLIVKKFSMKAFSGQLHAIMGPNGAGKSSLSKTISGYPGVKIESGTILFNGEDITGFEPQDRAKKGIFVSIQNPPEIFGLKMKKFLYESYKSLKEEEISSDDFYNVLSQKMALIDFSEEFLDRDVNVGFSGGQKKKSELLQMLMSEPYVAVLDEIDSGLDINSIRHVTDVIKNYLKRGGVVILITHYIDFLRSFDSCNIHLMVDGHLKESGGLELICKIEQNGYEI